MTDKYQEKARDIVKEWHEANRDLALSKHHNKPINLESIIAQSLRDANDEKCEKCKQEQSVITWPSEDEIHRAAREYDCYTNESFRGFLACFNWLRSKVEGK